MSGITIKSASDIEKMDEAGRIVEETLNLLAKSAEIGMTTQQLDDIAASYIESRGAEASFLNYNGYPRSICTSVNEQVVHGIPGKYRLRDGDILSLDVGAYKNGFHGDAARTVLIGSVSEEIQALVRVTKACFFEAIRFAKPGYRVSDIAKAIQAHAEKHGYGVVRDLVGHGIGRQMHEDPEVPNFWDYTRFGHGARLAAGMTIAIEPMINMGTARVHQLDDGWTVVTADGKPSAHYENTVLITEGEPRLLTLHGEDEGA
ncbi:MAG TPA: type I methionyl aminopeptidase [Clostridiales bacterium]|nr:type I methionyl aminopeptidase [Clostridiales bacterium]